MQTLVRSIVLAAALLPAVVTHSVSAKSDKSITLVPLGRYTSLPFQFDQGAVEISAYDPQTKRAFLTFAEQPHVEAVGLTDPNNPFLAFTIDLSPFGGPDVHATSVAVRDGVVAVAVPQGEDDTAPGRVVFFDVHGNFLSVVTVGALPDMLTFTPNGKYVLTANEGQPRSDYTFDPEGSVSIIDMSVGAANLTDDDVTTAGFAEFNSEPIDPRIRIFGPGATVAQDLEPEYLAVSHDSQTVWVTLQENNALAILDLKQKKVTKLVALGFKDHSVSPNGLDAGVTDGVNIVTRPVLGMYQPDAIAALHRGNRTYLVTANEGDVREYDGLDAPKDEDQDVESVEIEDIDLDPIAFPNAAALKAAIGKLKVTSFDGDADNDGLYDKLYAFGGRSFSVWDENGELVFDSGDEIEKRTAAAFPTRFNASNTSNALDNRSDDKGPEPEGVTIAKLFGRDYLLVVLERIGGVMVYDLTNPAAPQFEQYINTRNFSFAPNSGNAGDLGAEAGRVIGEDESPTGKPLLIVSNEVSGTLRVFEILQN
jgi:uncharacterized cupredoxin-like copper-binding protein